MEDLTQKLQQNYKILMIYDISNDIKLKLSKQIQEDKVCFEWR